MCGKISVITTFSLSIVSGLDGGGGRSCSVLSSAGHSIKYGYSVLTAFKPPKKILNFSKFL